MFDTRDKRSAQVPVNNQITEPLNAGNIAHATTPQNTVVPGQATTSGNPRIDVDMNALFGNWGDEVTSGTAAKTQTNTTNVASPPQAKPSPTPDKQATDMKTALKNNPMATRSLDSLTGDKSYQALTDEQKRDILTQFQTAPNAATTNYLRGLADYEKEKAADKSGDPEKEKARLAKLEDAKNPDSGTFSVNGSNYTISNGKLLGKDGKEAGTIDNLGNYKMTGDKESSNYYDNLGARVQLTEGTGKNAHSLLDLHATDPNGRITGPNMNHTFTDKVDATLRSARHEGMDMGIAPDGSYRDFATQDRMYAKGRSAPGKVVTNARGGESFHNYGIASDLAFYDAKGNITWPETGDYPKLWSRYGELAKKQGLTWGGDWTSGTDRPHVEYHPGLTASQASRLIPSFRKNGLEGAWDQMGIGQKP